MIKRNEGYMHQLASYIKKNVSKGYTTESLKWALISQGYTKVEVEKAITLANQEMARDAPILVEKPVIKVETIPPVEPELSLWKKFKSWFE